MTADLRFTFRVVTTDRTRTPAGPYVERESWVTVAHDNPCDAELIACQIAGATTPGGMVLGSALHSCVI